VATLCTLRLLRQLPLRGDYPLRCVAFATPSIGNSALASLVAERHWDAYLSNFLLPEDVVVQLTSPSQVHVNVLQVHKQIFRYTGCRPHACCNKISCATTCSTGQQGSGVPRAWGRRAPTCGGCSTPPPA
jgi:hypothetical protein